MQPNNNKNTRNNNNNNANIYSVIIMTCHCESSGSLFLPPVGVKSIAISVSVCPLAYLKNHSPNFIKFSVPITCGRGSVAL